MAWKRRARVFGLCWLATVPVGSALAVELPIRKAGLWEIKTVEVGSTLPGLTMQHCTDETIDKDMNDLVSPIASQICSKQDIQKTASGYVADSLCSVGGMAVSSHSEIKGDFNSAYTITTTSRSDLGNKAASRDLVAKVEAKWLGACKADQKPGDIVMPGGAFKLNVKDAPKMKDSPPGAKP
ncbi:MAG TPA: DUF3617 family protein [Bradyrhizobium sp.]|nr:DUF3617 family protein [Bradyrhizobium sp.]